jgi:hypothetical protein
MKNQKEEQLIYNSNTESNTESDTDFEENLKIDKSVVSVKGNVVKSKKSEYCECPDINFKKKLGKYTFGLDKVIPWEDGNFVFSGGLLYDIITERFDDNLMDIDLFFYGSSEEKINTINKLFDNLDKDQYSYLIGSNRSVIYVFIQGVPRIIQLIMTDKTEPTSIISDFDLTHVMSYSDGNTVYSHSKTCKFFKSKSTKAEINVLNKSRIIKYVERNVIKPSIILNTYNFVLNENDRDKYINTKKQIKLYKQTYNLSIYPNGEPINFRKYDSSKLSLINYFGCRLNYDKLDNHDFMEGVDMFGAFAQYVGIEKTSIVNEKTDLNEDKSDEYVYINNCELEIDKCFSLSRLYKINKQRAIYIPCKFLKTESAKLDKNTKVLKMYFTIDKSQVINYLKTKLYKYTIFDALNLSVIGTEYNKLKYKFDFDKDVMTFCDLSTYPESEDEEDSDEDEKIYQNEYDDELNICCKLCNEDIDEFFDLNDYGILDSLELDQEIFCLFDISVFMNVIKTQPNQEKKIKYIDINLNPRFIHKI